MKYLIFFLFIFPCVVLSQNNNYITNKEYNEFVSYVRDSLFRFTMSEEVDEEAFSISSFEYTPQYKRTFVCINWKTKLNINTPAAREALEPWYYKPEERLNRKREIDQRKLIHNKIKIYPDVLIWCRDSIINKSWATFLTKYYFTHPYFEDYPVYGLSEKQIKEYIKWKYPENVKSYDVLNKKEIKLILPKEKLEFTIGEYFKFYKYTRDSIARMILCQELDEEKYCLSVNKYHEEISPPIVKWKYKIKWNYEAEFETLSKHHLLTSEISVDNRIVNYTYTYLDFYMGITLPDSAERRGSFRWVSRNLGANEYIKIMSPIDIKKELQNRSLIDFNEIDKWQLIAFYFWKKNNYMGEDIFEGFIPYSSNVSYEDNLNLYKKDNDIELLITGKLTNNFFNFKISIPTIQVK